MKLWNEWNQLFFIKDSKNLLSFKLFGMKFFFTHREFWLKGVYFLCQMFLEGWSIVALSQGEQA